MASAAQTQEATAALATLVEDLRTNPLAGGLFRDRRTFAVIMGLDGRVLEMNEAPVTGRPIRRADVVGKLLWETPAYAATPEWHRTWRDRFELVRAMPTPMVFDDEFPVPGREDFIVSVQISCIRDEKLSPLGFLAEMADRRDLRKVERRLHEQERLRRLTFDQSFQFTAILEPDGTVVDVNAAFERLGLTRDQMVGRKLWDLSRQEADTDEVGEARARTWIERFDEVRQGTGPQHYAEVFSSVQTDRISASDTTLTPVRAPDGSLELILMEMRDRTESHIAQVALLESQERFQTMVETLPHMVWTAGPDGHVNYFASRWADFTGRSIDDLLGRGFIDLIHPDDRTALTRRGGGESTDGDPYVFRLRRHDGVWRWMEALTHVVHDHDGKVVQTFGGTLDVTERREAGEATRQREAQLRATLQMTGYGTYVWDVPQNRFSRDSEIEAVLGIPMESMMQGNAFDQWFALLHDDDRETSQSAVLGSLVPGGPDYRADFRMHRPAVGGGTEEIWVSAMGRTEFDEKGQPLRLIGVFADITQRRIEEESRMRLQKVEALGTLAGGIAHDFNNVIGAILSYARVAEMELKVGESPATSIAEIARGALRAGDIVKRLLTFSRDEAPRRVAFDLADVVEEARALVRPTMPPAVELHENHADGLPAAFGDPGQLHQVAVNLITNAGHAIGAAGGRIDLSVEQVTVKSRRPTVDSVLEPGDYLRMRVRDDGPGMSEAVAARIFDPFFTTKGPQEGTGLGLSAVQSIVRNHGGALALETKPGEGSTFDVFLPVQLVEDGRVEEGDPETEMLPEPVRVLFVDDEEALVRLANRALPYRGCLVTGFTDPLAALAAVREEPEAYDALITDLSMPGLSGIELAEQVRAIAPRVAIVLTSGYLGGEAQAEAGGRGVDEIVPKPCSIDDLADAIFRVRAG